MKSVSTDYFQSSTPGGDQGTSSLPITSEENEGNLMSTAKQLIIEPGATALSQQMMEKIREVIDKDELFRSFDGLPALSQVQWIRLVRQSVIGSLTLVDSNGSPLSAIETVVEFKGYSPSTFSKSQQTALITSLSTFVDVPPSDINIVSIRKANTGEGRERRLRAHRRLENEENGDLIWVTFHVELVNDNLIIPEQAIVKNRQAGANAQNGIGTDPASIAVIIASIVGGVVIFTALVIILVMLLRRRRKASQPKTTTIVGGYEDRTQDPAKITVSIPSLHAKRPKHRVNKASVKLPLAIAGSPRGVELSITPQKHLKSEIPRGRRRHLKSAQRKGVFAKHSLTNEQTMPERATPAVLQSNHYPQQYHERMTGLKQPRESVQKLGPKSPHILRMQKAILQPSEVVHI